VLRLLWLQASGCGGETVSLLGADQPDLLTFFETLDVHLIWHSAFSTIQGDAALDLFEHYETGKEALDVFVVEGAVCTADRLRPAGVAGSSSSAGVAGSSSSAGVAGSSSSAGVAGSSSSAGVAGSSSSAEVDRHVKHIGRRVRDLAARARYTVAVGTCASFGGVVACRANPFAMMGLQFLRDRPGGVLGADYRSGAGLPVINIPGCPAHPDWMMGTFTALAEDRISEDDLDDYHRPKGPYGKLAHHACPRNEYYEFKASAEEYSQQGCLFENLGCKATQCESDCNERLWLSRTGSCTRGGFPCLSCTSPVFPDGFRPFFRTEKIGDIPTTLPRDVPKAWYVGISGLAKLACPLRLRVNAVSFKPVGAPEEGRAGK